MYTLRDIVRCSDILEDNEDVLGFISEAALPLSGFGITVVDNIVVLITEYPSALTALTNMSYTVDGACTLLDLVTQELVTVSENASASGNSVIEYFLEYQTDHGDCGAFDYHGTFVQVILDALIEVEMEWVRETPPFRHCDD